MPIEHVTKLEGKAHRPGLYQCNECREQFTVTVKTVFERSKIPLDKWLAALFLMTATRKAFRAHQVHRSLGISYKSTWFMMHRLREAMRTGGLAPMGGAGEVVEVDETVIGKLEGAPKHTYQGYGATVAATPCSRWYSAAAMSAPSMWKAPQPPSCFRSSAPTSKPRLSS